MNNYDPANWPDGRHLGESLDLAERLPAGAERDALLASVADAGWSAAGDAIRAAQEGLAAVRDQEWPAALEGFARCGDAARELLVAPRVLARLAADVDRHRRRQHEQ